MTLFFTGETSIATSHDSRSPAGPCYHLNTLSSLLCIRLHEILADIEQRLACEFRRRTTQTIAEIQPRRMVPPTKSFAGVNGFTPMGIPKGDLHQPKLSTQTGATRFIPARLLQDAFSRLVNLRSHGPRTAHPLFLELLFADESRSECGYPVEGREFLCRLLQKPRRWRNRAGFAQLWGSPGGCRSIRAVRS